MADTEEKSFFSLKTTRIIGLVFLGIYALALVFPEQLWGVHHYTFLPPLVKYGFLFLVLVLVMSGSSRFAREYLKITGKNKWWLGLILVLVAGWLFHSYPIHKDYYGDAPRHMEMLGDSITSLNINRTQNALSLEIFDSKIGEKTVLNAVERIAYKSEKTTVEVFQGIATGSGVVFVFVWVFFVLRYVENSSKRFILIVVGISAPFIQNFFGHVEIYAPFFAVVTTYLGLLFFYLKTRKNQLIWLLFIVLFLCLKLHFISFLLVPSLIFALIYTRGDEKWKKLFTWKAALKYVILPVFVIGLGAYLFVFKDYNDPRFLNGMVKESERLFLPVLSPEAPLDNYNLFSIAHLLDFFNNTLHWAGAGLLVVIAFLFNRKKINWNTPEIILTGISLIFFLSLLFMVNPLLSMPMDWDLFSLAAPLLLFFLVAIMKNVEKDISALSAPTLAVALMTIPIVATNSIPQVSAKRLVAVGKHTFKTYWVRSAGTIEHGIKMVEESYIEELEKSINELEPYAHPTKDLEYSYLLWRAGKYYQKINRFDIALGWHLKAKEHSIEASSEYILSLMDIYYRMERYEEAFAESEILVKHQHPNQLRSIAMAVDCGLKANKREEVIHYCKEYLKLDPDNAYMSDLLKDLGVNGEVDNGVIGMELIKNVESAFKAGDFADAYRYAEKLIEIRFPNYQKALRMAIHCALEARMFEEAEMQCETFLNFYPNDPLIGEVMRRLKMGKDLDKIRELFMSGR